MFTVSGLDVQGIEVDEKRLVTLRSLEPAGLEPEVQTLLRMAVNSGKLALSSALESCDAYIVAVPTPVYEDHRADLSYVATAVKSIARVIQPGQLLVIESTIPPRTMNELVLPLLEAAGKRDEVLVAHCPERVLPGATLLEIVNNDRIIGGLTHDAAVRARDLYRLFVKGTFHLTDMTTSEFVKVMENTYRDVNIALANEFAKLAEVIGVNVWEAIRLANNHPRVNVLRPGPGVGGHCVAVDPWFLVQIDPTRSSLIRTARAVNDSMPNHVCDRVIKELAGRRGPIALLGLAYRGNVSDVRESPALRVRELLLEAGFAVRAHDPHVERAPVGVANLPLFEAVEGAEAIVVATDHLAFSDLDPADVAARVHHRLVVDTKACIDVDRWSRAGFRVAVLGVA
jgi:UDP-N-acetyl-D-mannosaminuronic acid dehydrogenase